VYLDVPDSYEALPIKVIAMCHHALIHDVDYMFLCDTDTYVVPGRLLESGFEQNHYTGYTTHRTWAQGGAGYWLDRTALMFVAAYEHPERHRSEDRMAGEILAEHGLYIANVTKRDTQAAGTDH
jgi:hypothetical protein